MNPHGRIAIIPARGGSTRLPRKNILDFFGKPMIAWTIEAALDSGLFKRVIVSTESEEVAAAARAHGAEVPFLRRTAFDDQTPVGDATIDTLRQCESHLGETYEMVAQLFAVCPIRDQTDIRESVEVFERSGSQFQISCFRYSGGNPWWAMRLDDKRRATALFPEALEQRSQDLPPLYCPTGAIWLARLPALFEAGTFYGPDCRFEPISWQSAIDIDDADDVALAKAVFLLKQEAPASTSIRE
jgi:N-acylneuraminate cytidylyltransferase